jgi:hypothetical protein
MYRSALQHLQGKKKKKIIGWWAGLFSGFKILRKGRRNLPFITLQTVENQVMFQGNTSLHTSMSKNKAPQSESESLYA